MKLRKLLPALLAVGFLLGVRDGRIMLWRRDNAEPVRIFSTPLPCLPPEDQQALLKGISVDSPRELTRLLEDYFS